MFELTILNDGLDFEELTKLPWSDPAMMIAIDPAIDLAIDLSMDPPIVPFMTLPFPEFEITEEITATD